MLSGARGVHRGAKSMCDGYNSAADVRSPAAPPGQRMVPGPTHPFLVEVLGTRLAWLVQRPFGQIGPLRP